ncbi:MAG: adenylate/guanylate cyclase domain-containing protein [Chloroflexi bacterium]|nr:adenylate/guanylate cyclase domain-containing protein [Chloroflexota bacterium]
MEPQIQYLKTTDGVSIAYYAMGQGTPLVCMNLPNSHLQMEWQMSDTRQTYEAAARLGTLVRYDHRGFGLSDRDVSDFSIEALLRDLQAVVDRLELKSFNLLSYRFSSPLAIAFAAGQPDRVLKLVLWPGYARLPETYTEAIGKMLALDESQWEFTTESLVRFGQGWSDEMSGAAAATLREAITPQTASEWFRQAKEWEVSDMVRDLTMPTLLICEKGDRYLGTDVARELANTMADARVTILDGASRPERMVQAVTATVPFLLGRQAGPQPDAPDLPSGTAVILFADIVDSTALTERLGDAAFRQKARELDRSLRSIISERSGTPVEGKLLGDGVLAVFTSARQAIEAALRCAAAGSHGGLPLHLGLHAGDVIREEGNVYGGAVNIASRISGLSAPGEVLVSDTVRGLARTSAGVRFEDRGEQPLKGVSEPVRVWAVSPSPSHGEGAGG